MLSLSERHSWFLFHKELKSWDCTTTGLKFEIFKPQLESGIFKYISWLNGSFLEGNDRRFLKKGSQDLSNVTTFANIFCFHISSVLVVKVMCFTFCLHTKGSGEIYHLVPYSLNAIKANRAIDSMSKTRRLRMSGSVCRRFRKALLMCRFVGKLMMNNGRSALENLTACLPDEVIPTYVPMSTIVNWKRCRFNR